MKKELTLLLFLAVIASSVGCGAKPQETVSTKTTETTETAEITETKEDSPETDSPETDIPEEAPEAEGNTETSESGEAGTGVVTPENAPDIDLQLQTIAEQYAEWGTVIDTSLIPRSGAAVTDMDRNGRLELVVSGVSGTGIQSEVHVFEVDEDGENLAVCSVPDNDLVPDIVFVESFDVYIKDGSYNIICEDAHQEGSVYFLMLDYLSFKNGELLLDNPIGNSRMTVRSDGSTETVWFDRVGGEISEEEFNQLADNFFEGGTKGTMTIKWIDLYLLQQDEETVLGLLKESWEGFCLK